LRRSPRQNGIHRKKTAIDAAAVLVSGLLLWRCPPKPEVIFVRLNQVVSLFPRSLARALQVETVIGVGIEAGLPIVAALNDMLRDRR
jgi:hypothetical protein